MHKAVCDGRPCRPGEGNRRGYTHWKQPYQPPDEAHVRSLSKKTPHSPTGPQYDSLVSAARSAAGSEDENAQVAGVERFRQALRIQRSLEDQADILHWYHFIMVSVPLKA